MAAKFYESGVDDFGFSNNVYKVFDGEWWLGVSVGEARTKAEN